MNEMEDPIKQPDPNLTSIENQWGSHPDDNFGYATDEERRTHRGLEDWELLEGDV